MNPVLLFAVAACVAALPAASPQAGARSLTAKAHEHFMVTIPTDKQEFAEYAVAVQQTMPAKVRHVLLSHFEACLDSHLALKGLDTTSEHDAEALISSAHVCFRHARADTPLAFKAALDAVVAFDRADAMTTGRRLDDWDPVTGKKARAECALLYICLSVEPVTRLIQDRTRYRYFGLPDGNTLSNVVWENDCLGYSGYTGFSR
jgi:hypothetical protein